MSDLSIFLGSGASASFGKPTTKVFRDKLQSTPFSEDVPSRLYHALVSYNGFPDAEYILECLKNLRQFQHTQGGGFILRTNNDIRFIAGGRDAQIRNLAECIDPFYEYIVNKIYEYYTITMADLDLLKKIYLDLFDFFLNKRNTVNIFTTNYDLAIEKFCGSERINLIDGFAYDDSMDMSVWNPNLFTNEKDSDGHRINLFKLYGSLNWMEHVQYGFVKLGDNQTRIMTGFMQNNLVIHPTLSPKEDEQLEPYKTLIKKFSEELQKSKTCVIIGFSFRDDELNRIFRKFLEDGKKLVVISPTAKKDMSSLKLGQVLQLHIREKYLNQDSVGNIIQDLKSLDVH
jgi:hypothetical protein